MSGARVFLPGATIGVMGGGQLGRMFTVAARQLGYRVHIFSPEKRSPAGQLADLEIVAGYTDREAVEDFARGIDVLTFEFENIPAEAIAWCAAHCVVRPAGRVLHTAQHRLREKEFLRGEGLPIAPFARVESETALRTALEKIGTPAVLKSASFGYDGKGQCKITEPGLVSRAWDAVGADVAVVEGFIPFEREVSLIIARGLDGATACFPLCENLHRNHILDLTVVPARVPESVADAARDLAIRVAESLDLVGVLAVEMFLLADGALVINELAPRPHNSGHFSLDACVTSQFEQQVRAVCGLPLGSTDLLRPCAMANLLGDVWSGGEPAWPAAAAFPGVKLHLYGKSDPRPGRKMGHLTALAGTVEEAIEAASNARAALNRW